MVAKLYNSINLDYLHLMTDGDEDMLNTMLAMLMEELPAEMQKMHDCHAQANWAELREVSHKMKSTLAFIGNKTMTAANQEIEHITKEKMNPAPIAGLLGKMDGEMPGVMEDLGDCLNG